MTRAITIMAVLTFWSGCVGFHRGTLPDAPSNAQYVRVNNVDIRYVVAGTGPAVLLLHGYGSSLDIWLPRVLPRLARNHRVIAIDMKGFGFSGRPPGDYTPRAHARIAWSVLDKLGVKDVAIVGHSWGASVALRMALQRQKRVRRVALYAAYVYEEQVPSFFLWARAAGVGETLFGLYYRERIEDRIALAYYDQSFVTQARIDRVEREMNRPGAVAAALATARGQRYAAVQRRYQSIKRPVLLLWGDNDVVTPVNFGQRLVSQLPDATLKRYPRCGHLPMVEVAAPSTRDLAAFLAKDVSATKPSTARGVSATEPSTADEDATK